MKTSLPRTLLTVLCLLTVGGCVAPPIKPDAKAVSGIKGVYLVPMETPPLTIDATAAATLQSRTFQAMPSYTPDLARAGAVLSLIEALLQLPELSSRPLVYPSVVEKQLEPINAWVISVELAQEAGRLLAASGRSPVISAQIQTIPGIQDRTRTVLMENWMGPIRAWYDDKSPSIQRAGFWPEGIDAILQIGIANYEIHGKHFLFQVMVKLFDASSGELLGRTRAGSVVEGLAPIDELFADDAQRFKALVLQKGNELIGKCLMELGVVSKP